MNVSDLMEAMAAAGAPLEAILLAVRALAAKDGEIAARRANDRDRKRRQRATIVGQSRDGHATEAGQSLPSPPDDIYSNPPTTPVRAKALPAPARGRRRKDEPSKRKRVATKPAARTGSRLPADWEPEAIADLPQTVQAMVSKWPAGAYATVAEMFRNHWLAEGRGIGAKRDWPRTWHNWLLRETSTVLRQVKAGVLFSTAASGDAPPVAEQLRSFEQAALTFDRIGRPDEARSARASAMALQARQGSGGRDAASASGGG